jgi:NitT/TauT family transport system ATP-binding protein
MKGDKAKLKVVSQAVGRPADKVIDIRGLSLIFQTADTPVFALSDIDLSIAGGEFVSFIGPSGCGKTTLMRVIADLERPTEGTITVNGVTPEQARLQRAYGYVFQAPALYPWRTVIRNITLPLEIMRLDRGEREARALSFEPQLLLMDEPFGALDEITRDHLNEQLIGLWEQTRKTVIFVTHSISEAVFLSTRIVVMSPRPGRILEVIDCNLPGKRKLDIRETPEFLAVAHRVRQALRAGHSYED